MPKETGTHTQLIITSRVSAPDAAVRLRAHSGSTVRFWDYADALYPPTEVGAIFVATRYRPVVCCERPDGRCRVVRTNLQTIGTCANTAHPCSSKIVNEIESPSGGGKPADGSRRLMSLATPKPAPPPDTTDTPLKPGDDDGAKEDPSCRSG